MQHAFKFFSDDWGASLSKFIYADMSGMSHNQSQPNNIILAVSTF